MFAAFAGFLADFGPGGASTGGRDVALDLEHVREIVDRVAGSHGLEVVDIEFRGQAGKARMLRIYIDKPGGVTHDDCANVSREVSTILDVEDAVPGGSYTLEVSSPGLDRKLSRPAEFERFTGSRVKLMTREPINGNRFFEGRLEQVHDGRLVLDTTPVTKKQKKRAAQNAVAPTIEIELANVERANLVPEI